VFVVVRQSRRSFVDKVDFVTSLGHGRGNGERAALGLRGKGPTLVITDLGVMRPDGRGELTLTAVHPGVTLEQVRAATGWELKTAPELENTAPPTVAELAALRALRAAR
jgi:glutaconate CoA-transferase subunit B